MALSAEPPGVAAMAPESGTPAPQRQLRRLLIFGLVCSNLLVCALCVVPVVFASQVKNLWGAVALVSLAAAAHQGWSANLFTFASDMFPRRAVGSVVGIGGTAGAIGGMLIALVVGEILQRTGSYFLIFAIAGSAYLAALLVIQLLIPRSEPAALDV